MFSTTIKRSVATLGVVAGLLAAAGPASADTLNGSGGGDRAFLDIGTTETLIAITADAGSGNDNVWNNGDGTDAAKGTQVGSEGVKAPSTEQSWVWHEAARNGVATSEVFELNTLGGNDTAEAKGTQVGSEGAFTEGNGQPCCNDIEYP